MKIISIILTFILGFFTYPASYLSTDESFDIAQANLLEEAFILDDDTVVMNIDKSFTLNWFNYYGMTYTSDSYIKGEITYKAGVRTKTEAFYLEPGEDAQFYSFIDNCLDGTKANYIESISFEALDSESASFELKGFAVFNRKIPDKEIFIEDGKIKIGVDLNWGGALSYLEDTDSDVQAVKVDGTVKVDSDAAERYGEKSVNNHVNLINRNDTGRLVQQSYYGTTGEDGYEPAYYNENQWAYNPVQGGNQYNENSKIVDVRIEENLIYIKCQPLDWAKSAEYMTPSYMEAYYTSENGMLHVSCRFVDFSGYKATVNTQELPAFYCIEPLNNFVYSSEGELKYEKELIFWPDAGYPNFSSDENWAAFMGEFDDSFGIGLYVPDEGSTSFLAGVYARGETTEKEPDKESPTSYIAVVKNFEFKSFNPYEYEYYITTGNVNEIRNAFATLE